MKKRYSILLIIFIIALVVRLYGFSNPVADWHSWRQADTSAVTRNFVKYGFTPSLPRYDDLSNIQSGKDNPAGYRLVEFPLYNAFAYVLIIFDRTHILSIEAWQRIVSILFSLGTLAFIYAIGSYYGSRRIGLFAAATFAILPFSVYYSRVILPEPALLFFTTGTLYFTSVWARSEKQSGIRQVLLAFFVFLFGSFALLIKPIACFFWLPIPFLWLYHRGLSIKSIFTISSVFFCMLLPFGIWRIWIMRYPEGIPAWTWLLNSDGIRFKGAFFYWLFAERISKMMLGYSGVVFLLIGILVKHKYWWFFSLWGLGALLYMVVFATGNVKHDYYQVILLPIIALYVAIGINYLLTQSGKTLIPILTQGLIVIAIIFSLAFSWYTLRGYYWINNPSIVEAGKKADELLPSDAKVIAPYGGDTAFLYQTNRQGWPIGFDIEDKINKGATYYVTISPNDDEAIDLEKRYTLLIKTDRYSIIQLQ